MWGTDEPVTVLIQPDRFIPTHVGNGPGRLRAERREAVHPHACGERLDAVRFSVHYAGSSPRMWGTVAGRRLAAWSITVHPHACGERIVIEEGVNEDAGSSPRMWGTGAFGVF